MSMVKTLVALALGSLLAAGCAHSGAGGEARTDERTLLSDSRIPKLGSAESRGVRIIPVRMLKEQGVPGTGEALERATVIVQ